MVNTDSKNTDIHIGEIMLNTIAKALKSFWTGFLSVAEAGGRARAAAELSRRGLHAEAKELMLK
jgi:hypothetical protein